MNRLLTQKILTLGELRVKLIVKVVSVGDNNDRRAFKLRLQQMGVEYHRQRFSAALRMPEHTAFSICHGRFLCGFHSLAHGKILMITGEYFVLFQALVGKQNKVLENIEQTLFLEDAFKKCVKLRILRVLIAAVLCFPFHKAVFTGGDRACAVFRKVTHYADGVIDKH